MLVKVLSRKKRSRIKEKHLLKRRLEKLLTETESSSKRANDSQAGKKARDKRDAD